MSLEDQGQSGQQLSPAGRRAVDAALEAWALERSIDAGDREAQHVAAMLRLLDAGPAPRAEALIDVTLARIAHADHAAAVREWQLRHEDADALDAMVMGGWQASRVPSALRARGEQHESLRRLATETSTNALSPALLIERTLAGVEAQRRTTRLEPVAATGEGRSRWRWRELVSVAAVLLLGTSVLSPILAAGRARQLRTACASNLGGVAGALGAYGNDFQGSLPMASASLAGLPWWNVGKDVAQSNSANLFTLRRAGYTPVEQMACAGNEHAVRSMPQEAWDWQEVPQVSYSYFVMFSDQRPDANTGSSTVLLADRSPVILRAIRREQVRVLENSPNHNGSGQWLLRGDGSTVWASTPVHRGDNIWLPANLELALDEAAHQMKSGRRSGTVPLESRQRAAELRAVILHGTEAPMSAQDSFVGP